MIKTLTKCDYCQQLQDNVFILERGKERFNVCIYCAQVLNAEEITDKKE